jgi:arsenite-transporting ATPase
MKKIFRMERTIAKVVRPVARRIYDVPLPTDDYFAAIEKLFKRLKGVDELLADPEITTVRLVANPEKIVLKETQRAFMYFCLYRMSIDGVIMNRIIPREVKDGYFDDWRESQTRYLAEAGKYFYPVPIFTVDLFRSEILGYDSLKDLARRIYGDRDPMDRFFEGEPYSFAKDDGQYRLTIKLPFLTKKDVELNKISDELIVRVGSLKQHILLPRQVAAEDTVTATLEGRDLLVRFGGEDHEQGKE